MTPFSQVPQGPEPQKQPVDAAQSAPFPMPTTRPSMAMPGVMPDINKDGSPSTQQPVEKPKEQRPDFLQPSASTLLTDLAKFAVASKPTVVKRESHKALLDRGLIVKGNSYYVVSKKGLQYLEDFILPP